MLIHHIFTALLLLILASQSVLGSWNQQFGDSQSTSYVKVSSNVPHIPGWNMTFHSYLFESQGSLKVYNPAVSEKGVIFLPVGFFGSVTVAAVDPTGHLLWSTGVSDSCESSTNVIYSQKRKQVYLACGYSEQLNFTIDVYFVHALSAISGKQLWSQKVPSGHATKLLSLSDEHDAIYYFGAENEYANTTQWCLLYLSLKDGSVTSNNNDHCDNFETDGETQIKVGGSPTGKDMFLSLDGVYNALYGWSTSSAQSLWNFKVPKRTFLDYNYISYAFSNGVIYASSSYLEWETSRPNGYYVFGLDVEGSLLFNVTGYCTNTSTVISPPVVDSQGYAFYSCGNQIFSIDSKGTLRWKSTNVSASYSVGNPPLPPSLNEQKGYLYLVGEQSAITILDMHDGSVLGTIHYKVPEKSQVVHPPIAVGDVAMYVIYQTGENITVTNVGV